MYQIMLGTIRWDLYRTLQYNKMDEDAAVAFAIAADQEALSNRLVNCCDVHLASARVARGTVGALNECARALYLLELAGKAKRFSEMMLGCAVTFERAAALNYGGEGDVIPDEIMAAKDAWTHLMSEGIFGEEMYSWGNSDEVVDFFLQEQPS